MKPGMEKDTIKTITTHYIDGTFVESHGREIMGIDEYTNRDLRMSEHISISPAEAAAGSPSENSSKLTRIAPIIGMPRVRCPFLPATATLWSI